MRFNAPPQWPVPPGWFPDAAWSPNPSWPPAPPGWRFFVDDTAPHPPAAGTPFYFPQRMSRAVKGWLLVAIVAVLALVAGAAVVYHQVNQPTVTVLEPVDSQGNVESGWDLHNSRSNDQIDCSFGTPSPYDKTAGVRFCGATADSADACWPAADIAHMYCLQDPFSNKLYYLGASGLNSPRKAQTEDAYPLGLLLDDGTQCRARVGGAWDRPDEHPDWLGYYGCQPDKAVWGPSSQGIKKGFGGWTAMVGSIDGHGHMTSHRVAKAYYVGVAAPGGGGSDNRTSAPGGTNLVTKCGRAPEFVPETIRAESGALVIHMKIVAHCPGGDVLTAPNTRISVTSDGQNIASGMFDLSAKPIVIAPGPGGSQSEPEIEHDFRFPVGTFWRLPVSTSEIPTNGASQQGDVDLNAKTFVVNCDQSGSTQSSASASAGTSSSSTATGPANPQTGDDDSASLDALRTIANADRPFVAGHLADRWVPQLSSKRPGVFDDGITWDNAATLREHLQLRLNYPEVRLLWSGDWSTFSAPDFWITIAGVVFPHADEALGWCHDHNLDRDHCYAKLVSTTHPVDDSTAFNP